MRCSPGCECGKHKRTVYAGVPFVPQTAEERRAYQRAYRAAHREKLAAQQRDRYAASPARRETTRRYRDANREQLRAYGRDYWRIQREADVAAMWEQCGGLCCYCELPLPRDSKVVIDHDHTCCPPMKSCVKCRRGLAHNNCNVAIGMADDDPARLERIAANLRRLKAETRSRITGAPVQEELPINARSPLTLEDLVRRDVLFREWQQFQIAWFGEEEYVRRTEDLVTRFLSQNKGE